MEVEGPVMSYTQRNCQLTRMSVIVCRARCIRAVAAKSTDLRTANAKDMGERRPMSMGETVLGATGAKKGYT